ncbi:MAG: hypothetical protein ACXVRJ_03030 [Gaiellaceae bacterium]
MDEDAVERRHSWLAVLVHRCECDVLGALQVAGDLPCIQTSLFLDDLNEVRVRPGERSREEVVQLTDLVVGLEHRRSPSSARETEGAS